MNDRFDGAKVGDPDPRERDPRRDRGLSLEALFSLARRGQSVNHVVEGSGAGYGTDLRVDARRRTRLRSAKVLDAGNAFVCDAVIQDRSAAGLRLLLARNVGLPVRFGVHDDETGEVLMVAAAWRRGQALGVRVLQREPAAPLKLSQRLALSGRYYGIKG